MMNFHATVVRVIDGDTVALNVDLGFRTWHESAFRLFGIDAPEVNAAGQAGEAARAYLRELLPEGAPVHAVTLKSPDKYGRWLVLITTHDGVNVNDEMVATGHARPYDGGARG